MTQPDWKAQAETLFFDQHQKIKAIAAALGKSTVSVSKHLNSLPRYQATRTQRQQDKPNRTDYFREQKQRKRKEQAAGHVPYETIKREHEIAVRILSSEKYY